MPHIHLVTYSHDGTNFRHQRVRTEGEAVHEAATQECRRVLALTHRCPADRIDVADVRTLGVPPIEPDDPYQGEPGYTADPDPTPDVSTAEPSVGESMSSVGVADATEPPAPKPARKRRRKA